MNIRDLIRLIEREGWVLARTTGSHRLRHQPEKLLLISSGNITNAALLRSNLATITAAFDVADFVELNRSGVVVHG